MDKRNNIEIEYMFLPHLYNYSRLLIYFYNNKMFKVRILSFDIILLKFLLFITPVTSTYLQKREHTI